MPPCFDSGQYESISDENNYASVGEATASNDCHSNGVAMTTPDADASEMMYLAVQTYTKRSSGEVDLTQGCSVNVMQTDLSGE